MKKVIKYIIIFMFALTGAFGMSLHPEFSFFWWLHFMNVSIWGGHLVFKLLDYLDN